MQNIPEAKFTSLILCHELLVNPNDGGDLANGKAFTTFILPRKRWKLLAAKILLSCG